MKTHRVFDLRVKEVSEWQVERPANVEDCKKIVKRVHDMHESFKAIDDMWSMLAEPDAPFSFDDIAMIEFYIMSLFGFVPFDILPYLFAAARKAIDDNGQMAALLSAKFNTMETGAWQVREGIVTTNAQPDCGGV